MERMDIFWRIKTHAFKYLVYLLLLQFQNIQESKQAFSLEVTDSAGL